jgi:hypothetical protein
MDIRNLTAAARSGAYEVLVASTDSYGTFDVRVKKMVDAATALADASEQLMVELEHLRSRVRTLEARKR